MWNWNWVIVLLISVLAFAKVEVGRCRDYNSTDPPAQQQLDKVSKLPGQVFDLSFAHYSGFVTVDQEAGRSLFYWFFEAVENPSSKPLVLWLNGGHNFSLSLLYTYIGYKYNVHQLRYIL